MPVAANAAVSSDDPEYVLTSAIQPNNGEKISHTQGKSTTPCMVCYVKVIFIAEQQLLRVMIWESLYLPRSLIAFVELLTFISGFLVAFCVF